MGMSHVPQPLFQLIATIATQRTVSGVLVAFIVGQ